MSPLAVDPRLARVGRAKSLGMHHIALFGIPGWVVLGILGAWIATSKGRGGCFWFAVCGILGPVGLIIAAVLPRAD